VKTVGKKKEKGERGSQNRRVKAYKEPPKNHQNL